MLVIEPRHSKETKHQGFDAKIIEDLVVDQFGQNWREGVMENIEHM